jgi:hypothetical protein
LARERNRENKWNMQNIEIRIELKRERERVRNTLKRE